MSEGTVEELQERVHQLEENLRKVKSLDELTGLYNRNTYYDRVRCRFENEPDKEYVIVCFDVEKFKFVNDRFGFVEGDRLLSYIGKKLQERAAKYDLVAARLSGDVFSFMDFEEKYGRDFALAVECLNSKSETEDIQNQRLSVLEKSNNINSAAIFNHEERINYLEKTLQIQVSK